LKAIALKIPKCLRIAGAWIGIFKANQNYMITPMFAVMFAAAGYSLIYLLLGGGLGGAFLIFIIAKMFGK
jgi:hypothetical protein